MAIKNWFKGSKGRAQASDPGADIEELITLGKFDRAELRLRHRLKKNLHDIYSRIRLGDVLMKQGRLSEAIDEYLFASEEYSSDGFFDKAHALLAKIQKMVPDNPTIAHKIDTLNRAKSVERRRDAIVHALIESGFRGERDNTRQTLQLQQLWGDLCKSPIIEALTDEQVVRLAQVSGLLRMKAGEVLVQVGEVREEIFILARGEFDARMKLQSGIETTIRSFGEGCLIGERALFEHEKWPAKYVCSKPVTALALGSDGLATFLAGETDPKRLLDILRTQHNDQRLLEALGQVAVQE